MKIIQYSHLTWKMLPKFLMFSLIVIISSCSSAPEEGKEVSSQDLKEIKADCDCAQIDYRRNALGKKIKGSLMYNINTEKVFSGACEEKWGDNSRKQIRQYSNGKLHGVIASWDENGILRQHLNYANGKSDGVQRVWNEKGELIKHTERAKGNYINYSWELNEGDLSLKNIALYEGNENKEYEFLMQLSTGADPYYTFKYDKEITTLDESTKDAIVAFYDKVFELANHKITLGHFFLKSDIPYKERNQLEWEMVNILISKFQGKIELETKSKYSDFYGRSIGIDTNSSASNESPNTSTNNESIVYFKISDPDGYSNLRDEPGGNVLQKIYENELFEIVGDEDGYKKVKLSDGTVGYIHNSRVIKN